MYVVNSEWGPELVFIKYLEKGHTFMGEDGVHGAIRKEDGVHGAIGRAMDRRPEIIFLMILSIFAPKQVEILSQLSWGPQDFYKVKSEAKRRGTKNPLLHFMR